MKRIHIRYFASIGEARGVREETVETEAETARALFDELNADGTLTCAPNILKVAVGDRLTHWDAPLRDGETVAFLPPFSGG